MPNQFYKPKKEEIRDYGNLNEADTRAKLIDVKLHKTGWSEDLITREYIFSDGRIEVIGETHQRAPKQKADYILRVASNGKPIAVVEAKEESLSASAGIAQAKDYAEKIGVFFAYSTNGHQIEEFDFITHKQVVIEEFPAPQELEKRLFKAKFPKKITRETKKLILQNYPTIPGFSLRYYQEKAISAVLDTVVKNKKRILLTLATGTGKTIIAYYAVWRLVKSGFFKRVLFIADRNFLRNQAYNNFEAFADARTFVKEGKAPKHQSVYFTTYQALYSISSSKKRLYQEYAPDFFDLVIIDECHRSGFGTWHEILKHFYGAVHLGMTATPKRTDNIDTYDYFGKPVYTYSYGQGVQDGYLAPFIVHRVLTNVDKEGKIELKEAKSKGAEIIYSAEEEPQEVYTQKEFEKKITLPDRTKEIVNHLTRLFKSFNPMAKTMVFCVDSDHADLMAKELQNNFADFGFDNFAVSIIARNGDIKESEYERFKDSEKPTPVIATTVDLLTTGVDVPSVRNIVIVKPVSSKLVFKQIIGRGSRLDLVTDKHFFRIIDYVGATKLFDDWERPPGPGPTGEEGPTDFFLSGIVIDAHSQEPISGAAVILQRGPNKQFREITNNAGHFTFNDLPSKKFKLAVSATDYKTHSLSLETKSNPKEFVAIELLPKAKRPKKVLVKGLPIYIAEEDKLILEKNGKALKTEEYIRYAGKAVVERAGSAQDLQNIWLNPQKRQKFLNDLKSHSVFPEAIVELLDRPDVDTFDLLAHLAFGSILLSRDERVEKFLNFEQEFLSNFKADAKEIIFALLEKYRRAGIEEIETPAVFEVSPLDNLGKLEGAIHVLGSAEKLKSAIETIRQKLYLTKNYAKQ